MWCSLEAAGQAQVRPHAVPHVESGWTGGGSVNLGKYWRDWAPWAVGMAENCSLNSKPHLKPNEYKSWDKTKILSWRWDLLMVDMSMYLIFMFCWLQAALWLLIQSGFRILEHQEEASDCTQGTPYYVIQKCRMLFSNSGPNMGAKRHTLRL